MSDSIPCPCCGVLLMPPRFPSIATTTWSDECACSDMVTCVFHLVNGGAPQRPSQEAVQARAEERHLLETARFEQKRARFAACYPDDPELDATEGAHPAWWRGHDHTFRQMMRIQERETARWREAGLSLQSVRDLVTRYEQDEISVGKLVDELRGLAEAAIKARAEP